MAITIKETFQVQAPIDTVWKFVMDPHQVASCMPGAHLDEVIDAHNFLGSVKIKVGAVTTAYKGKVQMARVDEAARVIELAAEGREAGGGLAKGSMTCTLTSVADGKTELVAEAHIDLTGRIMQVGRGMIEAVSHQLFLQFVKAVQARLEVPMAEAAAGAAGGNPTAVPYRPPLPAEPEPIRILPIILKSLRDALLKGLRRLLLRILSWLPEER